MARLEFIPSVLCASDIRLGWGIHQALDGVQVLDFLIVTQSVPG